MSSSSTPINVQERIGSDDPAKKPEPVLASVDRTLRAEYSSSADGVDSNLLIFFHGLGDTNKPFFALGKSLKLPQTAILSIQAPSRIPLLEEEAWMWWDSFDPLGEIIPHPNPSSTLSLLHKVLDYLTTACCWPASSVHLFGFAQGGSLASELSLYWSRNKPSPNDPDLGSCVTVSGPLLSLPTLPTKSKSKSKLLVWYRETESRMINLGWFQKGFVDVESIKVRPGKGGMPSSREEWEPIMRFWSNVLRRRQAWELPGTREEVYVVKG